MEGSLFGLASRIFPAVYRQDCLILRTAAQQLPKRNSTSDSERKCVLSESDALSETR